MPVSPEEALQRLREGNRRFVRGEGRGAAAFDAAARRELAEGQAPFAVVLGCADSRVPAEIVFDQGLGDLFVVRVAGNVARPSQIGSIEFAAQEFGSRLIVVLGHTGCGAIGATLAQLATPAEIRSPHLRVLVEDIQPALEELVAARGTSDPAALTAEAVRVNVRAGVERLRHDSEVLARLVRDDGLLIVGAEYQLETGVVEFLDERVTA